MVRTQMVRKPASAGDGVKNENLGVLATIAIDGVQNEPQPINYQTRTPTHLQKKRRIQ